MGHREQLLDGAKKCLLEKGYTRTTARDIVAASGTNLASIGYHYGSKEALLNAALFSAIEDWSDRADRESSAATDPDVSPIERFEAYFGRLIADFADNRPLWAANFEIFSLIEQNAQIREFFANGAQHAREGMASLFAGVDEETVDSDSARTVGAVYYCLLLGVLAQWLLDPERAPHADDLVAGLRTIAESLG